VDLIVLDSERSKAGTKGMPPIDSFLKHLGIVAIFLDPLGKGLIDDVIALAEPAAGPAFFDLEDERLFLDYFDDVLTNSAGDPDYEI